MGRNEAEEVVVFKHASIETSNDVKETLAWKMESLRADDLPIDTGLADYMAFGVDNLEGQIRHLDVADKEIKRRKKILKDQIEAIKVEAAAFLLGEGIEKMKGQYSCSSVSVTAAKEEKEEETEHKEFKLLIEEDELQDLLIALGKAEMATVTKKKVTKAQPAKLRINKRKIDTPEIENG